MAVGIGIEAVTGKAKLSDYPHDYQKGAPALATEEFLEILPKNKHRLGVSLNESRLLDTLERMYEESLLRVLLIKETLSKTDALIDAVVYRLYGLTEGRFEWWWRGKIAEYRRHYHIYVILLSEGAVVIDPALRVVERFCRGRRPPCGSKKWNGFSYKCELSRSA